MIPNSAFRIPNCLPLLASIAAIELVRGIFIVAAPLALTQFITVKTEPSTVIIFFASLTVKILIDNLRAKKFIELSSTVQKTIRKKIHAAIFDHNSQPLDAGELLTVTFDLVPSIEQFIVKVLPTVASLIILTPLILIVAAFFDPMSALIFLVTLPIAPFLLYLIGKAVGARNEQAQALLIKLNADFDELLRAIPTLKMFRQTEPAVEKLQSISERSTAAILDVLKLAFVSAFALELITTLAIALVAVTCGLRLTAGAIEFRAAFFILMLAPEYFAPIRQLGAAFHSFIDAKQSLERLKPFLTVEETPRGSIEQTRIPPSINIKNLSFTYRNKLTPALELGNLTIDAGMITVIKGESGSGKSTLLKLIAGINTPTVGEIFINDLPMSKAEPHSITEKIAYVPQQPHWFNASFIDNASLFNSIDPSTIKKYADEIGLDGKDHLLSRGQLQRLGLLRAILKMRTASIVLLDEPTAGLDVETEQSIVELIKKYSRRRTIIIAAHRPAVIGLADHIIDLDVIFDHDASN